MILFNLIKQFFFKNNHLYNNLIKYIVILFILLLRQWEIFGKPYLWAEDGTLFINNVIEYGHKSLFFHGAGYYHFISFLFTNIFYFFCYIINNIVTLPYLMWTSSLLISGAAVFYFTSEEFKWILEKKRDRFIVCLLVILLIPAESSEVFGTITNIQWWLCFYFFLLGLNICYKREMPGTCNIIILVLSAFSTVGFLPLFGIFTLLLLDKIKRRAILKYDLLKYTALLIPSLIQIISIFFNRNNINSINPDGRVTKIINSYFNIMGKIIVPDFITFNNVSMIFIGILLLIIITAFSIKKNKILLLFSLTYSLGFLLYCLLFTGQTTFVMSGDYFVNSRYIIVSYMINAFLLSIIIVKYLFYIKTKPVIRVCICVLLSLIVIVTIPFRFFIKMPISHYGDYTVYYKEFSNLYSKNGGKKIRIPLQNQDWHVTFPVNNFIITPNNNYEIMDNITVSNDNMDIQNNWIDVSVSLNDNYNKSDIISAMVLIEDIYYPMIKDNIIFSGMIPKSAIKHDESKIKIIFIKSNQVISIYEYDFINE